MESMTRRAGRGDTARYRTLKRAGLLAAALYVALAAVPKPFRTGEPEWFPFFSWSLFSNIPNDARDYALRVTAFDGRVLQPPVFLRELESELPGAGSSVVYNALQDIGKAFERGDPAAARERLTTLEAGLFGPHLVTYEVLWRHYDHLELMRHGRTLDERQLLRRTWDGAPR